MFLAGTVSSQWKCYHFTLLCKAGWQQDHTNALPIVLWMDSWAMILNHFKTVFELMDGDIREKNDRGSPSFFNLFAREACNGAPALLQEPCPAFLGTRSRAPLNLCPDSSVPLFLLTERAQESQTYVCGRFSVADLRRQGCRLCADNWVLYPPCSGLWVSAGQGYVSGLEGA